MNLSKILQKPFLISVFVFNIIFLGIAIFLLGYVQNLLDRDSKNNLEEIVSQNKNVITSKLLLDLNRLDIISSKISDGLRNKNITKEVELNNFLEEYSKNNIDDSLFLANKCGLAYIDSKTHIDISGRRYFKLAVEGISNISDRTISRIDGEYIFVGSVPLYHDNKIIGTIQKIYTDKQMNELFAASLFSSKGYMYVINSEGYVILHTKHPDCALKSDNYFRDVYEYGNIAAARKVKTDIGANKSGFMETMIGSTKTFSAYTPIEQVHDWYLVTSVPTDVIAENSNVVMKIFYMVLVSIVLIFLVSIFYFAWNKRRQKRELEKIAFVDNVTGGNTYNKFLVDVQNMLRDNTERQCYILNFDVDNFKYINNFYGFACGDKILQQIYSLISLWMKQGEIAARISGDRFVCFLQEADEKRIEELFSSIRNATEENLILHFSAGVYSIKECNENINMMVDKARVAAQTIKGVLNQHVVYYSREFDEQTARNEEMKRDLKLAIKNDEFVVFYQPKVDINSGKLVGAEALIRWQTRDGRLVPPGDFIPLSEKTGLVTDLDMIVFEKVLAFLRRSLDAGIECVPISVNFSRLHFSNEQFLPMLLQKLRKYKVPAHLIELELTESAIFDNFSIIYDFTEKVREYGVAIAMDDFGSGYSSLNMLKDLTIDTLKIDRAFLEEADDNEKRNIIFVSVVEMARKLNISLVVEGVETGENVDLMRECGCNIAQGYYFSRPIPEDDFGKLFREGWIC